ncbi:MAG: type II toxin-antitoxin system YoeB family toxin [Alistipes sp.]|nr:type II toxin-antitoxin system YoeB family toxin [Alistipes sp.]
MSYRIIYTPLALKHIERHERPGDKRPLKKLWPLPVNWKNTPPAPVNERLRHELSSRRSRRINKEHRLLYSIDDQQRAVYIYSLWGHY